MRDKEQSDKSATSPSADSSIPPCVVQAVAAAQRLYDVTYGDLPDLDAKPTSVPDAIASVFRFRSWLRAVDAAYGSPKWGWREDEGLLGLFGRNRETMMSAQVQGEYPFEIRLQQSGSIGLRRDQLHGTISDFKPLLVHAVWVPQPPSLYRAADVLGDPPTQFLVSCATILPRVPRDADDGEICLPDPIGFVPIDLDHWTEIRQSLLLVRVAVTTKVAGLVHWVRQQAEAFENAVLPTLQKLGTRSGQRDEWRVSSAGGSRVVLVRSGLTEMLASLAKSGVVEAARSDKAELSRLLPELATAIVPAGVEPRRDPETRSVYRVSEEIRKRIKLGLATRI